MKRFYCTVCQQTRRVRRMPTLVESPNAEKVVDRTGVCNWHSNPSGRVIKYTKPVAAKKAKVG